MKVMEDASSSCSQLSQCFADGLIDGLGLEKFNLNASQFSAVADCVSAMDDESSSIRLLWGPPGTGKTKTISAILWAMLVKGRKALACAPTNTAVLEVAARIVKLVSDSANGGLCFLNDIILFGNKNNMKMDDGNDLSLVFLESRAERLLPCFVPNTGWRHRLCSLIDLLENCVSMYQLYGEGKTLKQYLKDDYNKLSRKLRDCIEILYSDHPRNVEAGRSFQCMREVLELIDIIHALINGGRSDGDDIWSDELEMKIESNGNHVIWPQQLSCVRTNSCNKSKFRLARSLCVQELTYLCTNLELPNCYTTRAVQQYLLPRAKCILCTVSSSFRLYNVPMGDPVELLIVDEAAQLKECETLIPLQLPGVREAVLIGDEYQLPAFVKSTVSSFNLVFFGFSSWQLPTGTLMLT
jgi:senataxin